MSTKYVFSKETELAFDNWISKWGATRHELDMEKFYDFALAYVRNNDLISKDAFVRRVKTHTYTSRKENRGIAQRFYKELEVIGDYHRYLIKKNMIR